MKKFMLNHINVYPVILFSLMFFLFGFFFIFKSTFEIIISGNTSNEKVLMESNHSINSANGILINKSAKEIIVNLPKIKNFSNKSFKTDQPKEKNISYEIVTLNNDIPTLDFSTLPSDFFSSNHKTRKEKFILTILPLIIQENNNIRNNRNRLLEIKNFININKTLSKQDRKFLNELAVNYNLNIQNKHKIDIINELFILVDVIPNSIVLAQAANESGWGSSRFAKEFNALFGEYTFSDKNGIVPYLREKNESHLIKFFPTVNKSIQSYFKNINTHSAYKKFRETRKQLRDNNLKLDPIVLVKHLKLYAKDVNYIKNIQSIIRANKLYQYDGIQVPVIQS